MENFIYEYKTKVIFGNGSVKNNLETELKKVWKDSHACLWQWFYKRKWDL